jgi:hypothetical protein
MRFLRTQNMSALHRIARWLAAVRQRLISARRDEVLRCALFLMACLPVFLALRMQVKHWVNIPIWDEWDTPGGTLLHLAQHKLTWADLFAQHNESRKFFPRLIYIALAWLFGWDVRAGMVLTFFSASALSVFLLRRLRDSTRSLGAPALFAWLIINALLFGPAEYENFLCGYSFEIFLPVLALGGCIAVNLSDRPLGAKVLWNSVLAAIATYSFAHGMILWVLGIPIPGCRQGQRPDFLRRSTLWYLIYALAATVAIGGYFAGYQRPDIFPQPASLLQAPLLARFIVTWLGAVLKSDCTNPSIAGVLAAMALLMACLLSLFVICRNKHLWKSYYPWLLLAGFSLGSGLVTALGRANLRVDVVFFHALVGFSSYRYNLTSVLAYVATVGLLFRLYRDWIQFHPIWRVRFIILITVSATLLSQAWLFSFSGHRDRINAFQDNRQRARTAVIWSKALPDNPELFLAYPYTEHFSERVAEMKSVGLIKLPEISDRLIEAISQPSRATDSEAGSIEQSRVIERDRLRVAGWARTPARNLRADYVVFGWEDEDRSFHPFTAMPTGQRRSDLIERFHSSALRNAGFTQEIDISKLPHRSLTLRGLSVDLSREQVFPLQGTVRLDRSGEQN